MDSSTETWAPVNRTRCSRAEEEEYRRAKEASGLHATRSTASIMPFESDSTGAASERSLIKVERVAVVTKAHFPPGATEAALMSLRIGALMYVAPGTPRSGRSV